MVLAVLAIIGLVAAELALRFAYGLGDPPLYELDDHIEYMLVPSKTYHRFGNTFSVNSFSMRSPEFPPRKSNPRELRVMVIGDSIVNAGARIDQPDLATELLRQQLADDLQRPVVVGNISAGSWGPPNQLAYVQTFGLFNADVVLLVYNNADSTDVPGLEGIGPQWPQHTPTLALEEAVTNYAVRAIERITHKRLTPAPTRTASPSADQAECMRAVRTLASLIRENNATPVMIKYFTRPELLSLNADSLSNFAPFDEISRDLSITQFDSRADFQAVSNSGTDPFLPGDAVHASSAGQKALASTLARAVHAALASSAQTQQPQPVPATLPSNAP